VLGDITNQQLRADALNLITLKLDNDYQPIPGYETYYAINRSGQVLSLHVKNNGNILKQILDRDGYFKVGLNVKGKKSQQYVHRLLALTFLPNPENKPLVNHKNGNKFDNCLSNLEWVTHLENVKHAIASDLFCPYCKTKVVDHCTGKVYESIREAAVSLDISYRRLKRIVRLVSKDNCLAVAS
jgi:hypothetical protein